MTARFVTSLAAIALATVFVVPATAQPANQCSRGAKANDWPNPWIVHFDTGKTTLHADDAKKIAETAKLAKANFIQQVCVQGFADKQGNAQKNTELSLARARAVAAELRRNGVDGKTIVTEAHGEPGGNAASGFNAGAQADRRVEVRFMR